VPVSVPELKNKAAAAGIRSGYASIVLSNGSNIIKLTKNIFQTTDYGLVCLEAATTDGCIVWGLGVEGSFRGQNFSVVSPGQLHDFSYWSSIWTGWQYTGYTANYTLSW
jgi:hypothetical protein